MKVKRAPETVGRPADLEPLRIGELAERTGTTTRALRYYEERGLLRPERTSNRYRTYPHDAIEQVAAIQALFAAGLGSDAIAAVLPCTRRGLEFDVCPELLALLEEEMGRLDNHLQSVRASRELLSDALNRARTAAA